MIGGVCKDFPGLAAAVVGGAEICGAAEDEAGGEEAAAGGVAAEPVTSAFGSDFASDFGSDFGSDLASAAGLTSSGRRAASSGGRGRGRGGSTVTLARVSGCAAGNRGAIISPSSNGALKGASNGAADP